MSYCRVNHISPGVVLVVRRPEVVKVFSLDGGQEPKAFTIIAIEAPLHAFLNDELSVGCSEEIVWCW